VLIEHDLYSGGAEHIQSVRRGFEGIEECSEVGEDLEVKKVQRTEKKVQRQGTEDPRSLVPSRREG